MKKLRNLFAVCLLLLIATTATAQTQSDNTEAKAASAAKADVNGDGVVNEADIEEIIEIMKKDNGVKYYWYVGQTQPTSLSSDPIPDDTNFTNNKWHTLADGATQIKQGVQGGTSGNNWYVAFPESFGFEIKASDLVTTDPTATKLANISINGKPYNVYKLNSIAARTTIYAAKKNNN